MNPGLSAYFKKEDSELLLYCEVDSRTLVPEGKIGVLVAIGPDGAGEIGEHSG